MGKLVGFRFLACPLLSSGQKGGGCMQTVNPVEIKRDAFRKWLLAHAAESVGSPGRCFDAPLARWLSEVSGHVYGVDDKLYGRGCWEYVQWLPLPRWAELFTSWSEGRFFACSLTGLQALDILARVEYTLSEVAASRHR
jgi:hypothetical protein